MTKVASTSGSQSVWGGKAKEVSNIMWGAGFIRMDTMANYQPGDYIKAEFKNDETGESEWMWVCVDSCDEANRIVLGRLDSVPVLDCGKKLKLGSQLAVSFDNIREHRKPLEFRKGTA